MEVPLKPLSVMVVGVDLNGPLGVLNIDGREEITGLDAVDHIINTQLFEFRVNVVGVTIRRLAARLTRVDN